MLVMLVMPAIHVFLTQTGKPFEDHNFFYLVLICPTN